MPGTAISIFSLLLTLLILLTGCGSLKLDQPLSSTDNDWLTAAGSAERMHFRPVSASPPFLPEWQYNAGAGFASNAMLAKGNILFVSTLQGELHLVNIETGQRIGRMNAGAPISGSPILNENVIYIPLSEGDETIVAYDLLAGKNIWKKNIGPVESSLLLYENILYAAARNGSVYAYAPNSGDERWKRELEGNAFGSPSAAGGRIFIGTTAGIIYSLDHQTGSIEWSSDTLRTIMTTPVVDEKHVYVASRDSLVYAVDRENGELVWSYKAGSRIYSSPSVGNNNLIVGTAGGEVIALDPETGEKKWVHRVKSVVNSSPLIAGNFVYFVSLDRSVNVLNAKSGSLLWSYDVSSRLKTTPLIWNNRLIICAEDRRVYSFKHDVQ